MKRKTYRAFIDVRAKDLEEAKEQMLLSAFDEFRYQEDPFNDEEEGIILKLARLEIARLAMTGNRTVLAIMKEIGISDKELKNLQKKIERIKNR